MKKGILLLLVLQGLFWAPPGQVQAQSSSGNPEGAKQSRLEIVLQSLGKPRRDSLIPSPFQSKAGVRDKLGFIYNAIHREEYDKYQALRDSGIVDWTDYFDLNLNKEIRYSSPNKDTLVIANNVKVFGWHPHWMGEAYQSYDFRLLNYVSLFSYNLNTAAVPNVAYDNPDVVEGWSNPDFKLIEMAHATGCKVLITLTSFYQSGNKVFLDNKNQQQERLFKNLAELLVKLKADGLDINFEQIPKGYEWKFSGFIRKLRAALPPHPEGKKYIISVVLPKLNHYQIYQVDSLQQYVDLFVVTGYDFHIGADMPPGPVAPLYNAGLSIEKSVYHWLEQGIDRKRLLLGLPYYGGLWTNTNPNDVQWKDTSAISFQHLTYRNIQDRYRYRREQPNYNLETWTANYTYPLTDSIGNIIRRETVYFDDSTTLSVKFNWVLKEHLGGVGIWALGYDNGRPELWAMIDTLFAPELDTIALYRPAQESFYLPQTVSKYRDAIAVGSIFLVLFLVIGLIAALFDGRVRDVFFGHKTLRLMYIFGAFLLLVSIGGIYYYLKMAGNPAGSPLSPEEMVTRNWLVLLIAGVVAGILISVFGTALYERRRRRLP